MSTIGVGASYGNGWRQLREHFLMLFFIGLMAALMSGPSSIMGDVAEESKGFVALYFGISALAYYILFTGPIEYGVAYVYLRAAREDDFELKDVLEGFRNYLNVILARFMVTAIVVMGLLLFVVPGIVFACRLAFTRYLVVDEKMPAWDAIQESWRMTDGHAREVFYVGVLAIPICIAGLICLGVGIIVSIMWVRLAFASLYDAISSEIESGFDRGESIGSEQLV